MKIKNKICVVLKEFKVRFEPNQFCLIIYTPVPSLILLMSEREKKLHQIYLR